MEINKKEFYLNDRLFKAFDTTDTCLSNFYQLSNPIIDQDGLNYWNSEGYYMAMRVSTDVKNWIDVRKHISNLSMISGNESRTARNRFKSILIQDEYLRVNIMKDAVELKFEANPELKSFLINIHDEIIEKSYWNDDLFGVNMNTQMGANILGKILMTYRDRLMTELNTFF